MSRSFRSIAIVVSISATAMVADQQPPPRRDPSVPRTGRGSIATDRLNVAVVFLTETIMDASSREAGRIQQTCANANDVSGCEARESRPLSAHFVRVRRAPSFTAPVAGDLIVRRRRSAADWQWSLVYRTASDGHVQSWMRDVDWGYGPHLAGVRSRGGWIGLSGPPFEGDVWIYAGSKNMRGEASTIAGQVLELYGVRAHSADGRTRVVASGSYFITQVDRTGVVTFREELDIDMPCGEDVSQPTVMPPMFQAPASAFFDTDGRPWFGVKYTKGC